ncbi:PAPA-1-like family protein / zinc finger family protein, putative isoform 2 [Hibiscus syriacus]|uniref:PAPA-1-like family protein / zinc finger family protein, putative isoform 2 n=1 Tax=Hibiscus syriacus TaxID=106335 RepID=A0A6A3B6C9_HIBSY|nr:PAPA-1-like family protein / zinc finger family protein, putative isoform 2 [Hibiscus syriacus]
MESIGGSELAVAGCFVKKKRRGVSSRRRVTPQLFTHSYILMSSPTPTISCSGSEEQHFKNGSNGFGFIRRRPRLHRDEECSPRKRPGMLRLRQSEKILSQDSEGKKKEDEMKKQRDELAHIRGLFEVSCSLPSGLSNSHSFRCCNLSTAAIFSEDIGLPQLFNSVPCRQVIPDPNCTNTYKYRDSKSKLPLCSLGCYKAIHEQAQPLIAVIVTMHLSDSLHPRQCDIRQPWKHQNLLVYSIELLEIVDCFLLSFIRRISFHCCIPWGMIAEESGEMGAVDSFPCYGIYGDESMVATGFGLSKQDPQQQQQNFKDYGFPDGVSFNAQSLLIPTCFDEMAELGQINYGVCEDIDGAKKGNQQPLCLSLLGLLNNYGNGFKRFNGERITDDDITVYARRSKIFNRRNHEDFWRDVCKVMHGFPTSLLSDREQGGLSSAAAATATAVRLISARLGTTRLVVVVMVMAAEDCLISNDNS